MAKRITNKQIIEKLLELYNDTSQITQRDVQEVYEELREESDLPLGGEIDDTRYDVIFTSINNF